MAFLGVGFFAGIRAASPDMKETIDNYFKDITLQDVVDSALQMTKKTVSSK